MTVSSQKPPRRAQGSSVVDVHTHFAPAFLIEDLRRAGPRFGLRLDGDFLVTDQEARLPIGYLELFEPAAKLESLDSRHVEHAIVSLTPHLFLYAPIEEATEYARKANDALAAYIHASPRLSGFATLPLADGRASAVELERAVAELGFVGAQIGTCLPDGRPLDAGGLDAVFDAAERLSVPIMLHPYYAGPIQSADYFLNNSIGVPLDTCLAAARLMASGTLDRWQRLRLILVHGGGFLPYQIGRLDNAWRQRADLQATARHAPSEYLRRFWYDSVIHSPAALSFLVSLVGADRILLGTDMPYVTAEQRPVEFVGSAGLDATLLGLNAVEVLGTDQQAVLEGRR